jgi:glucose-6-phosphate isomerase
MSISLDQTNLDGFVSAEDVEGLLPAIERANADLENKTGAGNEYLGWTTLPNDIDDSLISELVSLGEKIRANSDCIVSVGIGGSYLGIRATIDFLRGAKIPVHYAGHNMSVDAMHVLLEELKGKNFSIVVISKSGTTTEPALAFRLLKKLLNEKYSEEEVSRRIICVTDEKKGALRKAVDNNGYKSYVIPDDVGGRFSILTPVGLVPLAIAGVDIKSLVDGARQGQKEYSNANVQDNVCLQYAANRFLLYKQGKVIEMLASFYDNLDYTCEWWKQLFGESEGKNHKGIFPASTILSTDLHSMGQLMQDGMRNIFETFIQIEKPQNSITIPEDKDNLDDFNIVAGKDLDFVNKQAYKATAAAHFEGGVPNMTLTLCQADAFHLGQLYYLFERAVGISGYLLEVNPFDQPGVEAYKSKMFVLLGKK